MDIEIKNKIEALGTGFEAFKAAHKQEIEEIKKILAREEELFLPLEVAHALEHAKVALGELDRAPHAEHERSLDVDEPRLAVGAKLEAHRPSAPSRESTSSVMLGHLRAAARASSAIAGSSTAHLPVTSAALPARCPRVGGGGELSRSARRASSRSPRTRRSVRCSASSWAPSPSPGAVVSSTAGGKGGGSMGVTAYPRPAATGRP